MGKAQGAVGAQRQDPGNSIWQFEEGLARERAHQADGSTLPNSPGGDRAGGEEDCGSCFTSHVASWSLGLIPRTIGCHWNGLTEIDPGALV